jgi:hypothetical protein
MPKSVVKLMIMGYARHGKDTAAEILYKTYGLKFKSSSFAAAEKVMVPFLRDVRGITYPNLETCYADRVNHRQDWHEQIAAYNTPDPTRLAAEIYKEADIYVGIRSKVEFEALRDQGYFDYSIWVDRSKHEPPESNASCNVTKEMANYVVDNNGSLDDLRRNVCALYIDLLSLEHAAYYERKQWQKAAIRTITRTT